MPLVIVQPLKYLDSRIVHTKKFDGYECMMFVQDDVIPELICCQYDFQEREEFESGIDLLCPIYLSLIQYFKKGYFHQTIKFVGKKHGDMIYYSQEKKTKCTQKL